MGLNGRNSIIDYFESYRFLRQSRIKKKRRGKRILMEPFLRLNPSLNALLQPQHVNDF
jgi:hypothetical protein